MDRLVDYFAVVGYDAIAEDLDSSDAIKGKVLTRIPEQDWENEPFMQGLELFCQPTGWFMTTEKHPPKYFVAVLTDEIGRRHYCAILSFSEPIFERNSPSPEPRTQLSRRESNRGFRQTVRGTIEDIDESMCEVDGEYNGSNSELLTVENNKTQNLKDSYIPKCLVLLSRHPELEVFKNCLGLIYTIYIEGLSVSLETVIANLLTVTIPPYGAPTLRFTIGAADKQVLQTPEYEELPVTRSSVSTLLRHLGILNVMNVLTAALVDQKLLFYSCSYTRLSDSCNALIALMFPFSYSYPYIPILPQKLLECTSSPTPFLFGIHSSLRSELHDLVDVITVDLDGGVISVPECISIPRIPEPYYTQAVELLTKVLCPDLVVADYAYPPEVINTSDPEKLDKEIRAIFLRLFCQLLMGYRSCLQVCRIHPRPIIRFQKEAFLNLRGYDKINTGASANFMPRLVESQAFSLFIQERGPPYRRLNVFDQEAASVSERMKKEGGDIKGALQHTKELSFELYRNENPSSTPPYQKVPKPSESAYLRPNQTKFPKLSPTAVQTFMTDQMNKGRSKNSNPIKRPNMLVPKGPSIESFAAQTNVLSSSSRRLDVLKSCVQFIFESRNLETKKIFHAVLRTLKNRSVRGALAEELSTYAKLKPCLDNQQFEYIARLCNCALDDCSGEDDEFYVAADLLPILSTFYRKLCPTVMQFLYTVVQKPTVWAMPDFWSFMFFRDVQNEMCRLYQRKNQNRGKFTQKPPEGNETANGKSPNRSVSSGSFLSDRVNTKCLEIAADELRDVQFKSEKETAELAAAEEGVIMSQIQHTAQLMIFLLVPLSETEGVSNIKFLNNPISLNEDSTNSYFASSFTGSVKDSLDDDDDASYPLDGLDIKGTINKFVSAFVDRSCSITGISAEYSNSLLGKVSGLVLMQHESLQDVARESKNLPPIKKVKLMQPKMLPGEFLFVNHTLRAYLAYDGRLTATGGEFGGPTLLPAEGAIYVSNYRITFIGIPCDTLASEQVIIRSFPLSGLFKLKMSSDNDRAKSQKIDGNVQHWATLFSATFQLMLIGFDEDVDEEKRVSFEQKILSLRNPNTIDDVFAVSQKLTPVARLHNLASENAGKTGKLGIADEAKYHSKLGAKSLVKQAKKKAGMTLGKQQRLHLVSADAKVSSIYRSASTLNELGKLSSAELKLHADENMKRLLSDKDVMDSLRKFACVNDFERLKILSSGNHFRMSDINKTFSVCKSYPVCSLVPKSVNDHSLRSISYCYQSNRYPSVVWMHPKSKAILLRASGIRARTAAAITKHGHSSQPLSDEGTVGSSVEVENFFLQVIAASKSSRLKKNQSPATGKPENGSANNEQQGRSPRQRGNNGFSSSFRDGRPDSIISLKSSKKWGTLTRVMGRPASEYLNPTLKSGGKSHGGKSGNHAFDTLAPIPSIDWDIQLYVFVDKLSIKAVKPELKGQVGFVCIDIPEPKQVRASFKSVLKCCLPVDPPPPTQSMQTSGEDTQMFRKGFETTGWMQQLSSLLTSAITIVNMLDTENASVMLALESGLDATPQLSSLVQLLLDPYYRTLSGFQTLLQKEWFSFGHRFSHRNHFNDMISTGFTPIFLQFLDCVYQIMCQFPLAFEFNLLFLQTLAYHCTSNRFQTFILDSDYERLEAGILIENEAKKQEFQKDQKALMDGTSHHKGGDFHDRILSVWKYVNRAKARSQVFQNALHVPNRLNQHVLRPISTVCRLSVWSYFTQEALADCPIYDGLLGEFFSTTSSPNEQETPEAGESWGIQSGRRVVNPCYDNVFEVQPDAFRSLKQQIDCLLDELEKPAQSWDEVWASATKSVTNSQFKVPLPVHDARQEAKLINKRISSAMGLRTVPQDQIMDTILFPTPQETLKPKNSETFNMTSVYQLQTTSEVRTYEGTLWKRGAYMKAWKQKYFVLDSTKHQLRQYESKLDQTHKSVFDMKEVESVRSVGVISGAPKGVGNDSFFELKTSKRLYYFIAENNDAAKKWIEALQNALEA